MPEDFKRGCESSHRKLWPTLSEADYQTMGLDGPA
jgi:hypothetical protein